MSGLTKLDPPAERVTGVESVNVDTLVWDVDVLVEDVEEVLVPPVEPK
jgi:hypothetical protein